MKSIYLLTYSTYNFCNINLVNMAMYIKLEKYVKQKLWVFRRRFKQIIKGRDVQYCTGQPPIKVFLNGRCFFFSIESYNIRENE